ncbi:MAG: OB-fold nucleic acid binding domain-containing protein, partial [Actinomycetota bacterium]
VMRVLAASGCSLAEADRIRRHLDDDVEIDDLRRDFLFRATAAGLGSGDAETVWRELASFASFGFCKAHAAAFAVPTYQSAWLKAHHTAAFLAGVLTHEPGMYPRRLIVEDARQHGVPILPLDANHSHKTYTVERVEAGGAERAARTRVGSAASEWHAADVPEPGSMSPAPRRRPPRPAPAPGSGTHGGHWGRRAASAESRAGPAGAGPSTLERRRREGSTSGTPEPAFGIRIGLQDVHGISDEEIGSILGARAERPFTSVLDFMRRTGVSRPVMEAMAHAGALDELDGVPRATRRDRLYVAMTADPQRDEAQLGLSIDGDGGPPGLREYTDAERVRAELEVTGMDVSRHLLSFYEPVLAAIGVVRAGELRRRRGDEWVMVAGVKVSSQPPAVRSGQRIIFLTLDDATGPIEVTVFERVQDRCARTVFHGFLLAVWGRLRRTGVGGVSIAAEEVWDLVALNQALREGRLARTMAAAEGSAERSPRKLWHASGGSAGW